MIIEVSNEVGDPFNLSVDEVVTKMKEAAEGLDDPVIRYSSGEDYCRIYITGTRIATDEEVLAKLAEDLRREEHAKDSIRRQMQNWKTKYPEAWKEVMESE